MPKKTYPKVIVAQPKAKNTVVIDPKNLIPHIPFDARGGYINPLDAAQLLLGIRCSGPLDGRAFFLNPNYNWTLAEDGGQTVLIPTKK